MYFKCINNLYFALDLLFMKKILGLDLGISSIGWAYINEAETENELSEIIDLGVRIIPINIDSKTQFEKGQAIIVNQVPPYYHQWIDMLLNNEPIADSYAKEKINVLGGRMTVNDIFNCVKKK